MALNKVINLPVIPLAKDTVLLPGVVLRIPVAGNRADISALLGSVYSRAASRPQNKILDDINIACVPLNSPLLSNHGQKLISGNEQSPNAKERPDIDPTKISKDNLFGYGVAAKISGVEGRGTGDFALLVEGKARVRLDKITQEQPFFEAEITYEHDDGMLKSVRARPGLMDNSHLFGGRSYARTIRTSQATIARAAHSTSTIFTPPPDCWLSRTVSGSSTSP